LPVSGGFEELNSKKEIIGAIYPFNSSLSAQLSPLFIFIEDGTKIALKVLISLS